MYWSLAAVALVPAAVVTVMSTVPAAPAGAMAVSDEALETLTPEAVVAPNFTVVLPATKLLPEIATVVPPPIGPELGETLDTVGTLT